jgi:prepilin-type N-terminal cleavage/methylation domain-containing protein
MKRNQSGFTLIEIAIVLVIIGLLLGGVLKGQELINSAKVKNLATDFRNIPVYVYGYQDKYRAMPGDDAMAASHVSGAAATTTITGGTRGNGVIEGSWNASAVTETHAFWQQVRLAGITAGPVDPTADGDLHPRNAVGGLIGITSSSATDVPITGMTGTFIVCSDGIAGKFAKQLDITLDDGNTATGAMRVTDAGTSTAGSAKATAAIVDDTTYLVCQGF